MATRTMKVVGAIAGAAVALGLVVGVGFVIAGNKRDEVMAKKWTVPYTADFPIPFPLTDEEKAALPPESDFGALAHDAALARGKHLVESRLGCAECHGADFTGGTMIDAPPMGKILGPNITSGGRTKGWGPVDWDRIVRHGIMTDGHTAFMPADDFNQLSDRDLSDVAVYIGSFPPSDKEVPPPQFGPVSTMLLATGKLVPWVYNIDHSKVPPRLPPPEAADPVFGKHLAQSCGGCHGPKFAGGPIVGGDPSWPPSANLTPKDWPADGYEAFEKAVRKGVRRDGGEVRMPMPYKAYASMTDVEVQAMWAFFQSLPAAETGER